MKDEKEYLSKEDLLKYLKENLKLDVQSKPLRRDDANVFSFQISLKMGNQTISAITFNA